MSKRSKYKNVRVEIDGHKFASRAEARRYVQLKDQQERGEILNLDLQRRFPLWASDAGGFVPAKVSDYVADFVYLRNDAAYPLVCEDVKGGETTAVFKLKKKMMKVCHGIDVIEVRL